MTRGMPTKVIGACLGLAGFAVAILAGLAADNPSDQILTRALLSMLGCQLIGLAIGAVAERTIDERLEAHRASNPMDDGAGALSAEDEAPVLIV